MEWSVGGPSSVGTPIGFFRSSLLLASVSLVMALPTSILDGSDVGQGEIIFPTPLFPAEPDVSP